MFRFVALIWDDSNRAQRDLAQILAGALRRRTDEWEMVFEEKGVTLYCAGARPSTSVCRLSSGRGAVLGSLFTRPGVGGLVERRTSLSPVEEQRLITSKGRALIQDYWGRYVAFLHDRSERSTRAIRDPRGEMDCLHATIHGVTLYFSTLEDCLSIQRMKLTVNWSHVVSGFNLALPDMRETSINEISRLRAGECIEHRNNSVANHTYWNPSEIVSSEPIDSMERAMSELRNTTQACVRAWAACYKNILLLLSGGLDSSIVLSCLNGAARNWNLFCMNHHYSGGPNSDERVYARLAAGKAECELIEYETETKIDLRAMPAPRLDPSPDDVLFPYGASMPIDRVARDRGVDAIFSGAGGDEVFCRNSVHYACADYVFRHGVSMAAFRLAMNSARLELRSVWRKFLADVHDGVSPPSPASMISKIEPSGLLTQGAQEGLMRKNLCLPWWLDFERRLPPGKVWQIISLSHPYGAYGYFALPDDAENNHPFLSQPLVELAFRIPTELQATGGWDRAVVRRAFAQDLPPEIAWRRSKSMVFEYVKHLLMHNLDFVKEVVLNGRMVKENIIDRHKLEMAVTTAFSKGYGSSMEISKLLSIELWLQRLDGGRVRAEAA